MVPLAPHLVHPLSLVVPAFDGAHPDRMVGVGLNLYDVMSVDRDRLRARHGQRTRAPGRGRSGGGAGTSPSEPEAGLSSSENGESWSPERHRVISGEEALELL